jgi:hypothetical protein
VADDPRHVGTKIEVKLRERTVHAQIDRVEDGTAASRIYRRWRWRLFESFEIDWRRGFPVEK